MDRSGLIYQSTYLHEAFIAGFRVGFESKRWGKQYLPGELLPDGIEQTSLVAWVLGYRSGWIAATEPN